MKIERVEKKCVKVRGGRSKEGRERDIREQKRAENWVMQKKEQSDET